MFQTRAADMFVFDDVSQGRSSASLGDGRSLCDLEDARPLFAAEGKCFRALIDRRNLPTKWDWARGRFGGG